MRLVTLLLGVSTACASPLEEHARRAPAVALAHAPGEPTALVLDGTITLEALLTAAVERNPALQARLHRWRAATHRIAPARALPEPTLTAAYFIRSVETRVGPQRARFGLRQSFPWELGAKARGAAAEALAEQERLAAEILAVRRAVAREYWELWSLREVIALHQEHLSVLRALSSSALAKIETGRASLADQQQIELSVDRLADRIASLEAQRTQARARLARAVGVASLPPLESLDAPPPAGALPYDDALLAEAPARHPNPAVYQRLGLAAEARGREASAQRWPKLAVAVDWVVTDEARAANVPGSGKDAWTAGLALDVPLWRGAYADRIESAAADAAAERARALDAQRALEAALRLSVVKFGDALRRVRLHREVLVPKAEALQDSVLGAYATGRSSLAQALLSQGELLELRIERVRSEAALAQARADVDAIVGPALEGGAP